MKERAEDPGSTLTAYLIEQDRTFLLKTFIPFLPAGKEVQFKITYATDLIAEFDRIRFSIPAKLTPSSKKGKGEHHLEFRVEADMNAPIAAVEATVPVVYHPAPNNQTFSVSLSSKLSALLYDFVLFVRLSEPRVNRSFIETHPIHHSRIALVEIYPSLSSDQLVIIQTP